MNLTGTSTIQLNSFNLPIIINTAGEMDDITGKEGFESLVYYYTGTSTAKYESNSLYYYNGQNWQSIALPNQVLLNNNMIFPENFSYKAEINGIGKEIFRIEKVEDEDEEKYVITINENNELNVNKKISTKKIEVGLNNQAIGNNSAAFGHTTAAIGKASHAEGYATQAIGDYSHAEGQGGVSASINLDDIIYQTPMYTCLDGDISSLSSGDDYYKVTVVNAKFPLAKDMFEYYIKNDKSYIKLTPLTQINGESLSSSNCFELTIENYSGESFDSTGNIILCKKESFDKTEEVPISNPTFSEIFSTTSEDLYKYFYVYDEYNQLNKINNILGSFRNNSHAEGFKTKALGQNSHVEGALTKAVGQTSHAEGSETEAVGLFAHAEGYKTKAIGQASHAAGSCTIASGQSETVIGKYNIDKRDTLDKEKYAFVIGGGENNANRKDILSVDWDGDIYIKNKKLNIEKKLALDSKEYTVNNNKENNNGQRFRVLSYNVGSYQNVKSENNKIGDGDIDKPGLSVDDKEFLKEKWINFRNFLMKANADVCLIQENSSIDSDGHSSLRLYNPIYSFKSAGDNEEPESIIFSKNNFLNFQGNKIKSNIEIENHPAKTTSIKYSEGLIPLEGYNVMFYSIHLAGNKILDGGTDITCDARKAQLDAIINEAENNPYTPYWVIGGDFNTWMDADKANLKNIPPEKATIANGGYLGWISTKPDLFKTPSAINSSNFLNSAIDNIICGPGLIINEFKVYDDQYDLLYSDHLPILIDVTIQKDNPINLRDIGKLKISKEKNICLVNTGRYQFLINKNDKLIIQPQVSNINFGMSNYVGCDPDTNYTFLFFNTGLENSEKQLVMRIVEADRDPEDETFEDSEKTVTRKILNNPGNLIFQNLKTKEDTQSIACSLAIADPSSEEKISGDTKIMIIKTSDYEEDFKDSYVLGDQSDLYILGDKTARDNIKELFNLENDNIKELLNLENDIEKYKRKLNGLTPSKNICSAEVGPIDSINFDPPIPTNLNDDDTFSNSTNTFGLLKKSNSLIEIEAKKEYTIVLYNFMDPNKNDKAMAWENDTNRSSNYITDFYVYWYKDDYSYNSREYVPSYIMKIHKDYVYTKVQAPENIKYLICQARIRKREGCDPKATDFKLNQNIKMAIFEGSAIPNTYIPPYSSYDAEARDNIEKIKSSLIETSNICNVETGRYDIYTSGSLVPTNSTRYFGTKNLVPCKPNTTYTFSFFDTGIDTTDSNPAIIYAWYDENQNAIFRYEPVTSAPTGTFDKDYYTYNFDNEKYEKTYNKGNEVPETLPVLYEQTAIHQAARATRAPINLMDQISPEKAVYVACCLKSSTIDTVSENTKIMISEGNKIPEEYLLPYTSYDLQAKDNIKKINNNFIESENLCNVETGRYTISDTTGLISKASSNFFYGMKEPVKCNPNTLYTFSFFDTGLDYQDSPNPTLRVAWYDENQNPIQYHQRQFLKTIINGTVNKYDKDYYIYNSTNETYEIVYSKDNSVTSEAREDTRPLYIKQSMFKAGRATRAPIVWACSADPSLVLCASPNNAVYMACSLSYPVVKEISENTKVMITEGTNIPIQYKPSKIAYDIEARKQAEKAKSLRLPAVVDARIENDLDVKKVGKNVFRVMSYNVANYTNDTGVSTVYDLKCIGNVLDEEMQEKFIHFKQLLTEINPDACLLQENSQYVWYLNKDEYNKFHPLKYFTTNPPNNIYSTGNLVFYDPTNSNEDQIYQFVGTNDSISAWNSSDWKLYEDINFSKDKEYNIGDCVLYKGNVYKRINNIFDLSDWDVVETFSNTKSYNVDDLVIYEGEYYKCIQAIEANASDPKDFNSLDWDIVEDFQNTAEDFSKTKPYDINDCVIRNGKYYKCKKNTFELNNWVIYLEYKDFVGKIKDNINNNDIYSTKNRLFMPTYPITSGLNGPVIFQKAGKGLNNISYTLELKDFVNFKAKYDLSTLLDYSEEKKYSKGDIVYYKKNENEYGLYYCTDSTETIGAINDTNKWKKISLDNKTGYYLEYDKINQRYYLKNSNNINDTADDTILINFNSKDIEYNGSNLWFDGSSFYIDFDVNTNGKCIAGHAASFIISNSQVFIDGKEVDLYSVHLSSAKAYASDKEAVVRRGVEFEKLLDLAIAKGKPFIIGGDMNIKFEEDHKLFKRIAEKHGCDSSCLGNGGKLGWLETHLYTGTKYLPTAIDNIVCSPDFVINNFHVCTEWYDLLHSDHVPVYADIGWNETKKKKPVELNIGSYNVGMFNIGHNNTDIFPRQNFIDKYLEVQEFLTKNNFDVLCVQELSSNFTENGLNFIKVFENYFKYKTATKPITIFSKYPIISEDYKIFNAGQLIDPTTMKYDDRYDRRTWAFVEILKDDKIIPIMSAHLAWREIDTGTFNEQWFENLTNAEKIGPEVWLDITGKKTGETINPSSFYQFVNNNTIPDILDKNYYYIKSSSFKQNTEYPKYSCVIHDRKLYANKKNVINADNFNIADGWDLLLDQNIENFSNTKSYEIGDYVLYEENCYKCIQTIIASESNPRDFNPEKWEPYTGVYTIQGKGSSKDVNRNYYKVVSGNIKDFDNQEKPVNKELNIESMAEVNEFSELTTYQEGDLVQYQNSIYKYTNNTPGSGPFDIINNWEFVESLNKISARKAQALEVIEKLKDYDTAIVCGDFNDWHKNDSVFDLFRNAGYVIMNGRDKIYKNTVISNSQDKEVIAIYNKLKEIWNGEFSDKNIVNSEIKKLTDRLENILIDELGNVKSIGPKSAYYEKIDQYLNDKYQRAFDNILVKGNEEDINGGLQVLPFVLNEENPSDWNSYLSDHLPIQAKIVI